MFRPFAPEISKSWKSPGFMHELFQFEDGSISVHKSGELYHIAAYHAFGAVRCISRKKCF